MTDANKLLTALWEAYKTGGGSVPDKLSFTAGCLRMTAKRMFRNSGVTIPDELLKALGYETEKGKKARKLQKQAARQAQTAIRQKLADEKKRADAKLRKALVGLSIFGVSTVVQTLKKEGIPHPDGKEWTSWTAAGCFRRFKIER